MIEVSASLLAADALCMGEDAARMLACGADELHVDIMDAHFVPNLSFGPGLVRALRARFPSAYLDVHLMMDNPRGFVAPFIASGASALTVHAEISEDIGDTIACIRSQGARCGLSLKPGTPTSVLAPYLSRLDRVLVMSVEPGRGGQAFQPEALRRIRDIRNMGFTGDIAVDGGVGMGNAQALCDAGASVLVMGTALLTSAQPQALVEFCHALKGAAD